MQSDKIEPVFGDHRHRRLEVIDHYKGCPVGAENPEGLLAIARAGL